MNTNHKTTQWPLDPAFHHLHTGRVIPVSIDNEPAATSITVYFPGHGPISIFDTTPSIDEVYANRDYCDVNLTMTAAQQIAMC